MKRDGIRAWCCLVDGCEYVEARSGECPAHHVQLCCLILVVKPAREGNNG